MASNPYVNKVQKSDGTVIMDISDSTVAANKLASGYSAYNAAGQKINGSLTEQGAKTVTPSGSQQTAVASGKYTTGDVVVSAVPTESPSEITANGTYSASSGKYWTGVTVNVQGSTETPLNVTANGTYTAPSGQAYNPVTVAVPSQTYYTGSSAPSASLGNDGDLYFKEA